ncbi:MAG: hypothetical protein A4S12_01965 [Proteobacteria bacterium SG_bin5]|nr:MAG: hypothetical protein A4S12_01965 [Proteobacteria bacterium SG_bin5]
MTRDRARVIAIGAVFAVIGLLWVANHLPRGVRLGATLPLLGLIAVGLPLLALLAHTQGPRAALGRAPLVLVLIVAALALGYCLPSGAPGR